MGIIAKEVDAPAYNADIPVLTFLYKDWRVIIDKKEINIKDIAKEADAIEVLNYLKDIVEKANKEAGK
jgi:hypothetical protein